MSDPTAANRCKRAARTLAALVFLLPLLTGCAYTEARALDLYDTFPASVGGGIGAELQARLTPFLGLGIGWVEGWRVGMDEQRFGPVWWEKSRGIPLWRYYRYQDYLGRDGRWRGGDPLWWPETHRLRASSLLILPGMSREGEAFTVPLTIHTVIYAPYAYNRRVRWEWPPWSVWNALNVELGLFAGVGGVRLGVSPLQFVDFLLGLFTVDLANDDPRELRPPKWPEAGATPPFSTVPLPPDEPTGEPPAGE